MRWIAIAAVVLHLSVFADEFRAAVGMPRDKTLAIIKANSGEDITAGLAVVGPKGEWPLHGLYWSLKDYKVVIEVSGKENVERLTYWTDNDFGKSKSHREKTGKEIAAFKIDPTKKRISVEAIKP